MKTKITSGILLSLFFLLNSCLPGQIIRGDGNIVTNNIPIGEYTKIKTSGTIHFNYSQSDEMPFLQVTTDQNIYDIYEFFVEDNNTLVIRPKKEYRRNTFIRPTEFTVNSNSRELVKAEIAGSSTFDANSPLRGDQIHFNLAGSGKLNLNERVEAHKLSTEIAGSATVNAKQVYTQEFRGNIAGSGTLNLAGETGKAMFEVAGSGDVRAYDFRIEDMKCEIAGSGDIEAYVNQSIDVSVAGSGRIKYKGNPSNITKSIAGAGSVKQVNE